VPLLVLAVGAVAMGTGPVGVVIALLVVLPIWLCRAFG
jgi:hypothetical protein